MAKVVFFCDGCGDQAEGFFNRGGQAFKPSNWYSRTDDDGTQLACSRSCLLDISKKTGKTAVVIPV